MSVSAERYPPPERARDAAGRPRFAYATFLVMNDSYLAGALTVAWGLRRQGSIADLVCLVTPEVGAESRDALGALYHRVIEVPPIRIPHRRAQTRQHVSYVFTRLHALRLGADGSLGGGYERVVLLDADVLPLRCFDHLFTLSPPAGIPNERKEHLVELDARGRQIPPAPGGDGWVWHRVYGEVCPHGRGIPREITDRVKSDPTNLGVNGSVILVAPSEREFRSIVEELELPETRRLVSDTWEWPDQQYLTARWSGSWSSIDARFSGLAGYPALEELCGTHFAGVKPWHFRRPDALRRFARYEDFRAWYAAFTAMVREDFPGLRRNRKIRTLLQKIAGLVGHGEGGGAAT